jgi:hypothetical protein
MDLLQAEKRIVVIQGKIEELDRDRAADKNRIKAMWIMIISIVTALIATLIPVLKAYLLGA